MYPLILVGHYLDNQMPSVWDGNTSSLFLPCTLRVALALLQFYKCTTLGSSLFGYCNVLAHKRMKPPENTQGQAEWLLE